MQILEISIDQLFEPREQVRSIITSEGLEELAESIKRIGVIEPLVVRKEGEKYEVIVGHRRLLAAKIAGLLTIPCIIKDELNIDESEIKLHENFYREDINPVDEAEFYSYLAKNKGLKTDEIAQKINKSTSYIEDRLRLLEGDLAIAEAVRAGAINISVAKELNMIKDESIRRLYLHDTVELGATLERVREWRLNWEREVRTKEALAAGIKPEELPKVLPKYYWQCPLCEKVTEINRIIPVHLCQKCYDFVAETMKDISRKEVK